MTNKTALVVVDLQNQYTDPKGCLYSACVGEHLPAILAGIEKLREKGVRSTRQRGMNSPMIRRF